MIETILALATGPAGAVICLLLILYGLYKLIVLGIDRLGPIIKNSIEKHLGQIDTIIQEHKEDREAWLATLSQLVFKLSTIEEDVKDIKEHLFEVDKPCTLKHTTTEDDSTTEGAE